MPRAGHRDRSTASINHRHRKIPPAFASNHLRSIRHYGIRMESERPRIGEVLRSIQLELIEAADRSPFTMPFGIDSISAGSSFCSLLFQNLPVATDANICITAPRSAPPTANSTVTEGTKR